MTLGQEEVGRKDTPLAGGGEPSGGSSVDSLGAQGYRICLPMQETWVRSLGLEEPTVEGNGYPYQYTCLKNSTDRQRILEGYYARGRKESDMTEHTCWRFFIPNGTHMYLHI